MRAGARRIAAPLLGAAVSLAIMGAAWWAIGWPAPGIALALGFCAYLLLRGRPHEAP